MFKKILKWLPYLVFPTLIVLIVGFLAWKNYVPGTWLLGWDSLNPELNFGLAFQRSIFGAWRIDQGLGAIAAHAIASDLPHIAILWLASFVVNQDFLRWFYIILTLLIGPLGMYFFLQEVFQNTKNKLDVTLASFLGSLAYLLNLSTLQNFYLPFEMFNTLFAALPWLILFIIRILKEGKRRNYLLLFAVSILATPIAYASALFYAYLGAVGIFLLIYWIFSKFSLLTFKRTIAIGLLILATNSFWILPNLYSIKNQSQTITDSKINTLFSPEAFIRNEDYGTVSNILIQKNFLFSWRAFDFKTNQFTDLFGNWSKYLAKPHILEIGFALAYISLAGVGLALIRRNKIGYAVLGIGLFSLFFLVNGNYPTGVIYKYLYDHYGVFSEAFRMPFTKFSILFQFSMAFFFAYFFYTLFGLLSKYKLIKLLQIAVTGGAVTGLVIFMLPAFKGDLISGVVKTKLPQEYFDAYAWLNKNPGRIAKLPLNTLYNWEQHSWKFEGSAWFTWFMSSNPQLDRDFDRWNSGNETFFNQANFALYQGDTVDFEKTLAEYRVNYILLDESIINAGGSPDSLYIPQIKAMLAKDGINQVAKFGFLDVYKTNTNYSNSYVETPTDLVKVNVDLTYSQIDPIYSQYNDYIQTGTAKAYPLINVDKRKDVKISVNANELLFENTSQNTKLTIPATGKITEDFNKKRGYAYGYNCDLEKVGSVDKTTSPTGDFYSAAAGGVSCDFFDYSKLSYRQGYVLRIKGQNTSGRSLKIYLYNYKAKKMDLEELLPTGSFDQFYVILPKDVDGEGYSLNIETRSFGRIASENTLQAIEFYPFSYDLIKSIYKGPINIDLIQNDISINSVKQMGDLFEVNLNQSVVQNGTLMLGQGYDNSWMAFPEKEVLGLNFPDLGRKLEHVKINSWANGWVVKPSDGHKIVILFWPQYLEWGGFALLVFGLVSVLILSKSKLK